MQKPLIIQFSGGRTSGFMAKFLQEYYPDREKHYLFENTGKEDPRTLDFVNECDRRWGLGVVWLEAVVHMDARRACTHKVVTYETASREGEPFEAAIRKYGVPNVVFKMCSRELKKNVAKSYIKSLGLEDFEIALGIRADEAHRINRAAQEKDKVIYPLADIVKVDKRFIEDWWSKQEFGLNLPAYLSSQRHRIEPRTLVLACQGVDAAQYEECAVEVLKHARPHDWIGLGGWCILGRFTSWLPVFWETLYRVLPLVARAGVRHVHIFGVLYLPALGGLQYLADAHGLTVSTDSAAPILNCTWKDKKKAGVRHPYWRDNVRHWQEALAGIRQTPHYREPPVNRQRGLWAA